MTAEEYIKVFTRGCSNELEKGKYDYWLTPWQAEEACNLKKEETIEKACKWLAVEFHGITRLRLDDKLIGMFRKAMEI